MNELEREFHSNADSKHDYSALEQTLDHIVNLSELEVPVGTLKIKPSEISVGGKSLKELYETADRVRSTATVFNVGVEDFDIHYRRYMTDKTCYPQKAAQDVLSFAAEIAGDPKLREIVEQCGGKNHNINLPEHQVLGTMLLGIVNIFYAGAGVMILPTKKTLDPIGLLTLNKDVAEGRVNAGNSPQFVPLEGVDEIDAMSSVALDVFTGRVFGTIGNGIVASELTLICKHYVMLMRNIIDSIDDSLAITALIGVLRDPKWANDQLGLSIFLNSINYHEQMAKRQSALKARMGGLSIRLAETFVSMGLYSFEIGNGAFANGGAKKFLLTSERMFNEMFSFYTITLASAINGDYPLGNSTGGPARDVMTSYMTNRIIYDSLISGTKCTLAYQSERLQFRILNRALLVFWKNDTAYSRLLRSAVGSLVQRYTGSIEIILSQCDELSTSLILTGPISTLGLYDPSEDGTPQIILPTKETKMSNKDNLSAMTDQSTPLPSVLRGFPNTGDALTVVNNEPLNESVGHNSIEFIALSEEVSLYRVGLASFLTNWYDTTISDPSSREKIGVLDKTLDNPLVFNDSPLGRLYEAHSALTDITPSEVEGYEGVLLASGDYLSLALSGSCIQEIPASLHFDSGLNKYKGINRFHWSMYHVSPDMGKYGLAINGSLLGETFMIPTNSVPHTFLRGLASTYVDGDGDTVSAEFNLAPCPLTAIQRAVGTYDWDAVWAVDYGNAGIAVFSGEVLSLLNPSTISKEDDVSFNAADSYFAVFGYTTGSGTPMMHAMCIKRIDEPKVSAPVEDLIDQVEREEVVSEAPTEVIDSPITVDDLRNLKSDDEPVVLVKGSPRGTSSFAETDEGDKPEPKGEVDTESLEFKEDLESLYGELEDDIDDALEHLAEKEAEFDAASKNKVVSTQFEELTYLELSLLSSFGHLNDKLYPTEDEVKECIGSTLTNENIHSLIFNRHVDLGDKTPDSILEQFGLDELVTKKINYSKMNVQGGLGLVVDSCTEGAERFLELAMALGPMVNAGFDKLSSAGHSWVVITRYAPANVAMVIHIMDLYNEDFNIEKLTIEFLSQEELTGGPSAVLEASDDLGVEDFPALYTGISLVADSVATLDDTMMSLVSNAQRKSKAMSINDKKEWEKTKEEGDVYGQPSRIRIIETLMELSNAKDLPRRLKRNITKLAVNKVHSIIAKHQTVNLRGIYGSDYKDLATLISGVFDNIVEFNSAPAAEVFFAEIEAIDLLDNPLIDIVVLDVESSDLGLRVDSSNITLDSIPFDFTEHESIYVMTTDNILFKHNPTGDGILRGNLSVVLHEA